MSNSKETGRYPQQALPHFEKAQALLTSFFGFFYSKKEELSQDLKEKKETQKSRLSVRNAVCSSIQRVMMLCCTVIERTARSGLDYEKFPEWRMALVLEQKEQLNFKFSPIYSPFLQEVFWGILRGTKSEPVLRLSQIKQMRLSKESDGGISRVVFSEEFRSAFESLGLVWKQVFDFDMDFEVKRAQKSRNEIGKELSKIIQDFEKSKSENLSAAKQKVTTQPNGTHLLFFLLQTSCSPIKKPSFKSGTEPSRSARPSLSSSSIGSIPTSFEYSSKKEKNQGLFYKLTR